ncbi:MAG: hypothetical protein ABI968_06415 [Acidobacteriota bacterium]
MKRMAWPSGLAAAGMAWLGLFSLLFSIGAAQGLWPPPPEGGFGRIDLAAGIALGVFLLLRLLQRAPA